MSSPYMSPSPTRSRQLLIPRPHPSPLRPDSPSSLPPTPRRTPSLTSPALSAPNALRSPSTPPPANKTRARDLLRKHYGLGVGPPPLLTKSDSGGKLHRKDPMDLDSTVFDAKTYYEQLITTSSLPTLLKRENELLMEIRQLDSERQSLVYNHHHELIAASDTIAAVKTRAESLDSDLEHLRECFSEISRLSAEVAIEQHEGGSETRGG